MQEHPILFSTSMVEAILDGRKTQTRRVMKQQPDLVCGNQARWWNDKKDFPMWKDTVANFICPYGQIGDRLWVRETFADISECDSGIYTEDQGYLTGGIVYRADDLDGAWGLCKYDGINFKWKPSIHMSRSASRILLEITDIRVERLQDISGIDCHAEGIQIFTGDEVCDPTKLSLLYIDQFAKLWQSINFNKHPWESNPWVWVIEFKMIKPDMSQYQ